MNVESWIIGLETSRVDCASEIDEMPAVALYHIVSLLALQPLRCAEDTQLRSLLIIHDPSQQKAISKERRSRELNLLFFVGKLGD